MLMQKTVNYPIVVPNSKYCWKGHFVCQFFDNEGGHSTCTLGFWEPKRDRKTGWILKPPKCRDLEEV